MRGERQDERPTDTNDTVHGDVPSAEVQAALVELQLSALRIVHER
jgi:hypothetical protein